MERERERERWKKRRVKVSAKTLKKPLRIVIYALDCVTQAS